MAAKMEERRAVKIKMVSTRFIIFSWGLTKTGRVETACTKL